MRCNSALIQVDGGVDLVRPTLDGVLRALLELTERNNSGAPDTGGGETTEEILVDAEVDGARYLLLRMPKTNRSRVQLSPRELEIVRMVAKGHPNKVIADVLSISSWTVCTHLRRIFAKLGVGSRAAMVAQLSELGLLTKEPRGLGTAG